ncbi:hypothetical protein [Paenibacillus rigui]|nr:hypothetical protein [Paenibacillus rigui]
MEFINVLDENIIRHSVRPCIMEMSIQIQKNIDRYLDLSFHQELYSLLSIFVSIGIHDACTTHQLVKIISSMDDISSVLALELLLDNEQNINNVLFDSIEKKLQNSSSWEEEYWLFKYHFFLKLQESKNSKIHKEYKQFIYDKYNNGVEKSRFFNPTNLATINSPIIINTQYRNSNPDISTFFKTLLSKSVSFYVGTNFYKAP